MKLTKEKNNKNNLLLTEPTKKVFNLINFLSLSNSIEKFDDVQNYDKFMHEILNVIRCIRTECDERVVPKKDNDALKKSYKIRKKKFY